ncbi:MAG: hypothetical protein NC337_15550 [Roseburia sp.]|nr:hypothetical protein [Roseburia sp.]
MEFNQLTFANTLKELKDTARLQGNMLTGEQLEEAFAAWQLKEEQLALIQSYLRENHIGIDAPPDSEEGLSGEDASFLSMYLEELKELPKASDGERRAVMMSALAGDKDAQARLTELFLPQVVEIAKLYAGQGALVEDLIGEGNVAVAMAVAMPDCVETVDEVEGFIGKMVMDAMEDYIAENAGSRQADEAVLNRVNDVNDKAKELYESLMRKVTVKEVAQELNLDEEEVRKAVKFSVNTIAYIEDGGTDDNG